MAQAAVDLAAYHTPAQASRRRMYSSEEADEDPSWQPSDFKPSRRKRRCKERATAAPSVAAPIPPSVPTSNSITIHLSGASKEMWSNFCNIVTEMIICKEGRRMFPAVEIDIRGLQREYIYSVCISVQMQDQLRYRFDSSSGEWLTINKQEKATIPHRVIPHKDSRNTGSYFMSKPVSFKTTKMTNNFNTRRDNQLILLSMHRYFPVITVHCHTTGENYVHSLPECNFIAVTSYQKVEVTQLKIETNQFAAAFRKRNKTPPEQEIKEKAHSDQWCGRKAPLSVAEQRSTSSSSSGEQHPLSPLASTSYSTTSVVRPDSQRSGGASDEKFPENGSDSGEEEDDAIQCPVEGDVYDDIPPHIRPFFFQPLHHSALSNTRCCPRSRLRPHLPPPPPPPPPPTQTGASGGSLDRQILWSSVAILETNSAASYDTDSDGFSLGLISDLFSL